mmetsp:Transcript_40527/g.72535  ORF Transcript_40527/g.72535 Transcript_40527/m.72535 type:complete len:96 (-) Transcript_40527:722-1009(-)
MQLETYLAYMCARDRLTLSCFRQPKTHAPESNHQDAAVGCNHARLDDVQYLTDKLSVLGATSHHSICNQLQLEEAHPANSEWPNQLAQSQQQIHA